MKLEKYIPIEDYPPKLKQLAIKNTLNQYPNKKMSEILEVSCWGAFTVLDTPEGAIFWSHVYHGCEFEWQEDSAYELY